MPIQESRRGTRDRLPPSNLPASLVGLIGREQDLDRVCELLAKGRLVTLVGAGGVGKTQLALHVAVAVLPRFPDGARLVELAALSDARLVPTTVAEILGVPQRGGEPLVETLRNALRARHLLVMLDTCEHLLSACAELVADLLRTCPDLRVVATSRERLGIVGEVAWRVPSLAYPAEEASHEAVAQSPAVRLFIERATEVLPSFELTARNAPAVADVCRRLDGVPLALELAAARVPVLSPRQIAAHLGNRFELLKAGRRVVPSRQQTLRAAIDWSHDLLSEPERRLLRRLAVFADGWDLEAVEAVCGAPDLEAGALVDVLGQLVEKSLVVAGPRDDEMRYRLLETVREYAWERLTQAGEADALRDRHRDWCLGLVERVPPEWLDPAQVDLLDAVQDELRAALRWSIERGTVEVGLRLAIGCWPMWYLRGRFAEGRTWLLALAHLATTTDVEVLRGRALAFAGHLAFCEGDTAGAETLLRDGLALAERSGDRVGSCVCSLYLGHVVGLRSTRAESEKLYDRALALARGEGSWAWQTRVLMVLARVNYEQGNTPRATTFAAEALELFAVRDHPTSRARVMALNGRLAASTGDHTAARALAEQSVALLDRLGDKQGQAYAHGLAAQSALDRGDRRDAARHLEAVLVLTRETRERMAVARGLEGMVELLAGTDPARAARLAGVAAGVRETARLAAAPVERERLERALVRLRSALGRAAAATLQADGRARATGASIADLAEEVAIAAAAARLVAASEPLAPAAVADARAGHGLTRREQEVAVLVARGLDSRHIATELVIAEGTVRIHVEHILAKLELHSRSQLAVWVLEHGLLRSSS